MGDKTGIEWTDATWNPVSGCSKLSQGCKNCYAKTLFPRVYPGRKFEDVRLHPERLDQPLRWKRPRRIFVNSMSDLFHDDVPDDFIAKVFGVMFLAKQHTFQVLTKRPQRMQLLLSLWQARDNWTPPPNVQLGVSVEDQATADERIPQLLATPAAIHFLSMEPLLEFVELRHGPIDPMKCYVPMTNFPHSIDWVIVGGESGPNARPMHPAWVRSLRDQCVNTGTPFFFKQWGEWLPESQYAPAPFDAECATNRFFVFADKSMAARVGKKLAGRLLDGHEWNEVPR